MNTLKLLRFPFSLLLMPVFLLALSQIQVEYTWKEVLIPFFIIHFLVYPASNGYNSYMDRDEGSIGGLEKPPMPTKMLFYITLLMDFLAVLGSFWFVNAGFSLSILLYILASRAYSARQIRIKKYPILAWLLVVFFQGAFTYYMTQIGVTKRHFEFNETILWVLLACSFQIAGVYPLTQIYQHKQDKADGVTTISYLLGYKGTFIFAGLMFLTCNICYYLYFLNIGRLDNFVIVQLFFLPIVSFFVYWFLKVSKNIENANFKNTMLLNLIAAICMNICFLVLLLKH
jgi:4-hydroxybenzoate polyprenyltransferase